MDFEPNVPLGSVEIDFGSRHGCDGYGHAQRGIQGALFPARFMVGRDVAAPLFGQKLGLRQALKNLPPKT
jgi:hypothetical protein